MKIAKIIALVAAAAGIALSTSCGSAPEPVAVPPVEISYSK